MSAFMVGTETMQRAAVGVLMARSYSESFGRHELSVADVTRLGVELYAMNREALRQRYGDDDEAPTFKGREVDYSVLTVAELIQVYKSMQCLEYQCSEGNVPSLELFKRLEQAAGVVAGMIVSRLPEYERAKWG